MICVDLFPLFSFLFYIFLAEFSQDVTDVQMGHVAPLILPELYKVFIGAEVLLI